jgi:hypothetical protein
MLHAAVVGYSSNLPARRGSVRPLALRLLSFPPPIPCPALHCTAAGGLLDYAAVREGLASGHIAGLGLDVQEQEPVDPQDWLAQHPRWVLARHRGCPRPYSTAPLRVQRWVLERVPGCLCAPTCLMSSCLQRLPDAAHCWGDENEL